MNQNEKQNESEMKQNEKQNESEGFSHSHSHFHSHSVSHSDFIYTKLNYMFEFQKLEVYKKAKIFHGECKKLILKNKLDNYVKDQLGRASFSIVLNIAEGSGKYSKADRKNYFVISRASIFECAAVLDILHDEEVLKNEDFNYFLKMADELSRILYDMIKNLS